MNNLGLIDWALVAYRALWIVGLSLILAALSFADYRAAEMKLRFWQVLKEPAYQAAIQMGLLLTCLGLLGGARSWWEQIIWVGLAVLASIGAYQAWIAWRARTHAH
ncbi:MAG: hypothetical protein HY784_07640 [Chloroflexi bacterium]|nr:hypothetical protein [Chloroflexota bacterium]